jgi:UDP-2-acetamido-3-amino-2,3-dideoxy-glucuronate N-acetyltransferase
MPQKNKFWAHPTAEIQKGARIGKGTKIWHHSQVLRGAEIGENCIIGHNCFVGSKARVGNRVKIESNTDVWDLVTLEDYVFVGPSAVFTNDINPRSKYPKSKSEWRSTLAKEGATIGANATILCGHTVGRAAMIGAGAVVTEDIPDYAIVKGVPGKVTGWMCECGSKLKFKKNKAVCGVCQRKYKKEKEKIILVKD